MSTDSTHTPTELGSRVSKVNLLAAVLSTLCILHCLAIPLLISVLALSIPFRENETVHVILVLTAAPATLWVMYRSLQRGHHRLFAVAAAIGLALLFAGTFAAPLAQFEEPLVVIGALMLVSAHMWHWYVHRAA